MRESPTHWCHRCGLVYWNAAAYMSCSRCGRGGRPRVETIPDDALAAYLIGGQSACDAMAPSGGWLF